MSVLIKGMEMPREGTIIAIYKLNGRFYASMHGTELCPLVEVKIPHGRLVDFNDIRYEGFTEEEITSLFPTIIEAEEGVENNG